MQITIHRGASEIGGTIIELAAGNSTILLDMGLPLSSADGRTLNVAALKPDAVLVSHPHQDHYGLIDQLASQVPVYMGKVAQELIIAPRIFLGKPLPNNNFQAIRDRVTFTVGEFTIAPFLVDHSAVDAYAFLVEAQGKRIFYSGDFRASGNKFKLFERLCADPPQNIDLLLMEGTMLHRNSDAFPDETAVKRKIEEVLKEQRNISFLISSSQNIDRLVSAAHACRNTGKKLVVDIYTAWVLEKVKALSKKTPTMAWDEVAVYAGPSQNAILKNHRDFFDDFSKQLYRQRITKEELMADPARFLYLSRMSHAKIMDLYKQFGSINLIYSQWLGYLKCRNDQYPRAEEIAAYQNDPQVNFHYAHTSGHATIDALKKFAAALKPHALAPIHTEYPADYAGHFDNVIRLNDGEPFVL